MLHVKLFWKNTWLLLARWQSENDTCGLTKVIVWCGNSGVTPNAYSGIIRFDRFWFLGSLLNSFKEFRKHSPMSDALNCFNTIQRFWKKNKMLYGRHENVWTNSTLFGNTDSDFETQRAGRRVFHTLDVEFWKTCSNRYAERIGFVQSWIKKSKHGKLKTPPCNRPGTWYLVGYFALPGEIWSRFLGLCGFWKIPRSVLFLLGPIIYLPGGLCRSCFL